MTNLRGENMFNYDKLKTLIDESGKTKTFLCKKLGREPYYLRDVLKQKTAIPYEYQVILARELNVTVDYLNDEEEKNPATESGDGKNPTVAESPKWKEYQQLSSQLTEQELSFVISQLKGILHNREDQDGQ